MALTVNLGRHTMWREDDVLGLTFNGVITLSDSQQLRQVLDKAKLERGHCFLLVDLRQSTGIDPDARRYMAEWSKSPTAKLAGTATFGVSFGMRAISMLMINAIKLLGKLEAEVVFLKEEVEARRWIDEQRAIQFPGHSRTG